MTISVAELRANGVEPHGITVREWRKANRLRAEELAKLAGLHPTTLDYYETGKRPLAPKSAAKLDRVMREFTESMRPAKPMRECRRCGVLIENKVRGYCADCGKEMRANRIANPGANRRGRAQRMSKYDMSMRWEASKPPPPPPGAPASDRVTGRPYGSAFGKDSDWPAGTRPEAWGVRVREWT